MIPKAVLERGAVVYIHRNLALSRNVDLCIIAHPLALGVHPPRCHGNTKRFGAIGTKVENEAKRTSETEEERGRKMHRGEGMVRSRNRRREETVVTYVSIRFSLRAPLPLCIPFPSSSLTPPSPSLHLRTFPPAAHRPPSRGMPGDREQGRGGRGRKRWWRKGRRWMPGGVGADSEHS